ncbi:DUF7286 family protein [Halosimplex halobium]|uniref:DUF7286 family protein n=1 Tax=Halosimplex halobium TaxID=3396618 RepID=UPI003F54FBCD
MNRNRRTLSVATSNRARVPFAVVGVLVLITSATVVGVMQSREDADTDTDVGLAMDQAQGAAQSVVREAVSDAARAAAREPVTIPADTPAGRALANGASDPDPNAVYRRYVKLRAYLEVQAQLDSARQRLSDGSVTRTSLPPVSYTESSIRAAIDRVDLEAGMDDPDDDLSNGTVTATIDGLTTEVVGDGEIRASETEPITVSVASTSLLLQHKTQKYQDKLAKGFFASGTGGFGKQFAARLYPLMYAKAYYERMAPPGKADAFGKMVMKKDIEVLANSANFAVQGEVFGTRDPGYTRVMGSAYACMVVRNVEKLYEAGAFSRSGSGSSSSDDYTEGAGGSSLDDESSTSDWKSRYGLGSAVSGLDAKDFCAAAAMVTGGASGTPPSSVQEVVNQFIGQQAQRAFNKESTVEIDKFAEPALDETLAQRVDYDPEYSDDTEQDDPNGTDQAPELDEDLPTDFTDRDTFERLIDRVFSYSVSTSTSGATKLSGEMPAATEPPGSGWSEWDDGPVEVDRTVDVTVDHSPVWDESTARTRDLHEFRVEVTNVLTETREYRRQEPCSSGSSGSGTPTPTPTGPCYEYDDETDRERVTWEVDVTVSGTYSDDPAINVSHNGTDGAYTGSSPNFEEAVAASIREGLNVDPSDPDGNFGDAISTGSIESASDLESAVSDQLSASTSIDPDTFVSASERSTLRSDLEDEVVSLHEHVVGDESAPPEPVSDLEVSPTEMATGSDVFGPLRERTNTSHHVYYDMSGTYDSARQKAIAEARMEYVDAVHRWIDRVESARSESSSDVDDEISSKVDGATNVLNKGLDFASDQIDGSGPLYSPGTMSDTDLLGDIRYTVDASPTYLTTGPVSRATVPAVRPSYATVTEAGDTQHVPMAVRKHNTFGYPGVPIVPWPSYWYLSVDHWSVQVKGEYGRFEVTADNSAPASPKTTTYVRQEMPVDLEIAGQKRRVGQVDPINFSASTAVVIPVPGGTVYPKPRYGVGDDWTIKTDRNSKPWRNMCSATWGHVGPGFNPGAINAGKCSNINEPGEGPLKASLADYVPGSSAVSDVPLEYDSSDDEFEFDAPGPDNCEEDDLTDKLEEDSDAENWYDGLSQSYQRYLWKYQYCRLPDSDNKTLYADLIKGDEPGDPDDDQVANTWRAMLTTPQIRFENVENALYYLLRDGNGNGDSLIEEHDVTMFLTADDTNSYEGGVPSHREPGIVTQIETVRSDTFARVYDSDGYVTGNWLARPSAVRGYDTQSIINRFALWNNSLVTDVSTYGWGEYDCVAKVFVPRSIDVPMRVSYAGGFHPSEYPNRLDRDAVIAEQGGELEGGVVQYEIMPNPGTSAWPFTDPQWKPLGSIEAVARDATVFDDRWDDVDAPADSSPATGDCQR